MSTSLCPVADDVDILGIFLKVFGAVVAFLCLAVSICHSFRRGCFHKKGHNENKWVQSAALMKGYEILTFFFFLMHSISLYFSYNWPAQNSGVEYGDADEVNLQSTPRSLEVKSKKRKSKVTSYFLFFTGSFPPQVFLCYLTADTEDAM